MHSAKKKKDSIREIEIETLRSIFKLPDRLTKASVELKKALISCDKKEIFRSDLMVSYIKADWKFARPLALIEFAVFSALLITVML